MWEYKVTGVMNERNINEMGDAGWELVATLSGPPHLMYFKRPKCPDCADGSCDA